MYRPSVHSLPAALLAMLIGISIYKGSGTLGIIRPSSPSYLVRPMGMLPGFLLRVELRSFPWNVRRHTNGSGASCQAELPYDLFPFSP